MTKGAGFVAGATGYTGRAVVERLIAEGYEAVAHVRPDSPKLADETAKLAAMGAKVDATPWEEAAMTETLRRLRPVAVFALLGTTAKREKQAGKETIAGYEAVDYGLSALLLRAAKASGVGPRFIYLSAATVKEGTSNAYLSVRARVEKELRESGLAWFAARPVFVTGPDRPEDRKGERFVAGFLDAAVAVAGAVGAKKIQERWGSMDAATLARGLVRLVGDERPGRAVEADELRGAS
jgi:uncharacterized protein YbjT (DUF2867 family)